MTTILDRVKGKPTPKAPTRAELARERERLEKGHVENVAALQARQEANRAARLEALRPFDEADLEIQEAFRAADGVDARLRRLEEELRRTSDPRILEALQWLGSVEAHLRGHFGLAVPREEELLADLERAGVHEDSREGPLLETLRREKRLRDLSTPLRATVAQSVELLRAAQIEAEPDLGATLSKIAASIPVRCPCGTPLPELAA